jgi:hypothetical protein
MPPAIMPPPAPIYQHLPPHLAQQYANLPDLYPISRRQASVAPPPVPQLAPAFVQAPAPASAPYRGVSANLAQRLAAVPPAPGPRLSSAFVPTPAPARYSNLPADLAQRLATLPPLMPVQRGRGRGRGGAAVAPLPYSELAAQYTALPHVCCYILITNI